MRRAGLSEVLASVSVVGLTAALILPLVLKDRQAPARTACMENMKQIGASLLMYSADYDGILPRTTEERPSRGFGAHWTYLIQPYVHSESIFVCPADTSPSYTYQDSGSHRRRVSLLSYINNYAAVPAHDFYPVPVSALTDPASMIVIGERRGRLPDRTELKGWKGMSAFDPGQPCRQLVFGEDYQRTNVQQASRVLKTAKSDKDLLIIRLNWNAHGEVSNYTFVDGHARAQELGRTLEADRFEWGERFYPRSMPEANCDQ